ncbi:MAG: hypothetical protein IT324_21465 [Anaerolineae bacterium]|nr:hypothetical protein [Anaerolineae bacterium]
MEQKKYQALRIVSTLYKAIAVLFVVLTILAAVVTALGTIGVLSPFRYTVNGATYSSIGPGSTQVIATVLAVLGTLLSGTLISISLYAFANLIDLMIDTEENTRATAVLLNRLLTRRQSNE